MSNHMSEAERAQFADRVAALYVEGMSIREIAVKTGRAFATVRTALVSSGVPLRSRWHVPRSTPLIQRPALATHPPGVRVGSSTDRPAPGVAPLEEA